MVFVFKVQAVYLVRIYQDEIMKAGAERFSINLRNRRHSYSRCYCVSCCPFTDVKTLTNIRYTTI